MKIVFMGTPDFAVRSLETLIHSKHEVIGVVTQPDKPKGRGKTIQMTPVKELALEHGIPVFQPKRIRNEEAIAHVKEWNPDVIVVAAFGQLLPKEIIDMPQYGCLNIHASLLPKYRGASPIQQAVINGEKESGVTIMKMDEGLDTGDMLKKKSVQLDEKETGESLHDKLALLGGPLMLEVLEELEKGTAVLTPQKDEESSYAKMLKKDMGHIDWEKPATVIECLIRGLNSWPSAYTGFEGKTLKIWNADVVEENSEYNPGTIVRTEKDAVFVQTGEGLLKLKEVQLEGKKRMDMAAFLRGYHMDRGTILQ